MTLKMMIAAGALACAVGTMAKASTVFSDSFAIGAPTGTFTTKSVSESISGGNWTVTGGSVDWIGTYWQSADNDGGSLDISGNAPGAITTKAFPVVAGTTYSVDFFISGNTDGPPPDKIVNLSGSNAVFSGTTTFHYDTTAEGNSRADMKWIEVTAYFTASTTGNAQVTFTGASSGQSNTAYGAAIDNVNIASVPLPSAMYGGAALLGGVFVARRLRRA